MTLAEKWMAAKAAEKVAQDERRKIEDELIARLGIDESLDGTVNATIDEFKVKIVGRLNRKVDSDMVKEIAIENDLVDQSAKLFRWSAELALTNWKATDDSITKMFAPAITVTPGRPSFTITKESE